MTIQQSSSQAPSTVSSLSFEREIRRLQESGKLKQLEKDFAVTLVQCGWRDDMKDAVKDAVRDNGGVTKVMLDQIVAQVVPQGRDSVPLALEDEMKERIRQAIRQERR